MIFTIADLQHRLPVAPASYDGRACAGHSFSIHDDIPDGAVFTSIVSIAREWSGKRVTAFVYRGENGHFFRDAIGLAGRPKGEITRIASREIATGITHCIPTTHQ